MVALIALGFQVGYSPTEGTAEVSFNTGAQGAGLVQETPNITPAQRVAPSFLVQSESLCDLTGALLTPLLPSGPLAIPSPPQGLCTVCSVCLEQLP